ncbi:MAG: glycosyltransferase [Magnetococcales bacterium]|nr:glycosyltransferase [Magnetococcales bacterium]
MEAAVVVPVRGRPELLRACLASLAAQQGVTGGFEVVVCDDGSSEDLTEVVGAFADRLVVRLLRQPPRGPAAARNLGVRGTRAPVVIFADSDVVVDGRFVAGLLAALAAHPSWSGAEAALHPRGGGEGPLWDAPRSTEGGAYHTAGIAYRREALLACGGFDETFLLPACEDVELACRMLEIGRIGFVPEAKVYHPSRRVTWATHWRWRLFWKYELILAVRYGILAFPGRPAGRWPRLRLALSAVATLPLGRFRKGLAALSNHPREAATACLLALFDVVCGLTALPTLLTCRVEERKSYLQGE